MCIVQPRNYLYLKIFVFHPIVSTSLCAIWKQVSSVKPGRKNEYASFNPRTDVDILSISKTKAIILEMKAYFFHNSVRLMQYMLTVFINYV